jgi:hypothetical protein
LYLASACKLAVISDTRCMMDNARRSYRLLDGAIFLPLPGMSAGTWDASARWTFGRAQATPSPPKPPGPPSKSSAHAGLFLLLGAGAP